MMVDYNLRRFDMEENKTRGGMGIGHAKGQIRYFTISSRVDDNLRKKVISKSEKLGVNISKYLLNLIKRDNE
jgi:hypothetical protein